MTGSAEAPDHYRSWTPVGSTTVKLLCCVAAIASIALSRPALADVADGVPPGQTRFRVLAVADGLRNLVISVYREGALRWFASRSR